MHTTGPAQPEGPEGLENAFPHWKRNAALFLVSQTVSLLGSAIVHYAIIWHITLTTKSGVMLTIAMVCGFIPQLALSPFGGVWADRHHRKYLIILSDGGVALATLALALVLMFSEQAWAMTFLVLTLRAAGTGIQMPAVQAAIPQIVPPKELSRMGGINGSLQSFIFLAAPMISGALLKFMPLTAALFIDVITAVIGIGIMLTIPIPAHKKAGAPARAAYLDEMRAGLAFIAGSPFFSRFYIFLAMLFLFLVPMNILSQLMIARFFGEEVWRLSLTEALWAAGAFFGGLIIARFGSRKILSRRIMTICGAGFMTGLMVAILGVNRFFPVFAAISGFIGFASPFMSTSAMVYLQENVEDGMQGRAFSLLQMMGTAMMALGVLVFGPIADSMDVRGLLVFSGLVMALVCVVAFNNGRLRQGAPVREEK